MAMARGYPDGEATEIPMLPWDDRGGDAAGARPRPGRRPRGRNLTGDQRRRIRDMLGALLMHGMNLSRVDAAEVLRCDPEHLHTRVSRVPPGLIERFKKSGLSGPLDGLLAARDPTGGRV